MERLHDLVVGSPGFSERFGQLNRALQSLLPDDAQAACTAVVNGVPIVLVLTACSLFATQVALGEAVHPPPVIVRRHPFVADHRRGHRRPKRAAVQRADRPLSDAGSSCGPTERASRFDGIVRAYDGWQTEPDSVERFGESVTGAVGWNLPGAR
jgi:hypothetical protein